mmetsp:Transcript_2366/g.3315  ORF Transcript_2366/g.3315 Transcript_2366/m.3315 type:complete len:291 (-) Transcript_2366:145-1017(-)
MLSCNACTSKTEKPGRKCMDGSKCTSKNCPFAHASPSSAEHMAGDEPTSCRDGIQCTTRICQCAHPCKGLQCMALEKDWDGHVMKVIMEILKESHGPIMARQLGRHIKHLNRSLSAALKRAGGLQKFCRKHADKIKWVKGPLAKDPGRGKVELVKTTVVETTVVKTQVILPTPSLESAACGSCNTCNFETKKPGTKWRLGPNCTNECCPYAHASPSDAGGRMAGRVPTSCRYGMQCKKPYCQFSHPNKVSSFNRHSIEQITCAAKGVIMVSIVSAWGEVCIAYTSVWFNS